MSCPHTAAMPQPSRTNKHPALTKLSRRMDKHDDHFNEEIENVIKYQAEGIIELKSTLEGCNSRLDEAQMSELEDKTMEHPKTERPNKTRILKSDGALRDIWDNSKWNDIYIIRVPEREERVNVP